jgi:hypothetical protein
MTLISAPIVYKRDPIKKIVLKAQGDPRCVSMPLFETEYSFSRDAGMLTISDIYLGQWEIRVTYQEKTKEEKVADIVGPDKAKKVMEALGL